MAFHSLHFGPLSIETNARGDLDLVLNTGPLAPQVLAIAFRSIVPDAWNVHCIMRGGVPTPVEGERPCIDHLLSLGHRHIERRAGEVLS